ncbi:Hm13 [Symbiodinium natans]|uniref:Hm13 protein n=1 Tax=Symbiodinium natans TaxID=878477 RepID=A0A812MXQ6_9DINO|nr:Hm13 [Symbiodinium natans]
MALSSHGIGDVGANSDIMHANAPEDEGPTLRKKRSSSPKPKTPLIVAENSGNVQVRTTPQGTKFNRLPKLGGLSSDILTLYGASAGCILVFVFLGEWLRRDIPAGKFEKIDKTLIDIDDFCVHELGPYPKCHPRFGHHVVLEHGIERWVKNSDVSRGGPYPPGHPENPEWLSKSTVLLKQAPGNKFGEFQSHVHLVLLPALCVMLASKQSVWFYIHEQPSRAVTPVVEQQDAFWFPILGSGVLFGLFAIVKLLGHDWLKQAIAIIMVCVCALGVASNIDAIGHLVGKNHSAATLVSMNVEAVSMKLEVSLVDVLGAVVALTLAVTYMSTGHWIVNNVLGFSFCLLGIRSLNLSSYSTGVVLLGGLFVYDVFWVFFSEPIFGSNVMVSVAKGIEAPIKLLLPRDYGGCGDLQFNMLGLGDIAVPGLFMAFLAKWDAVRMADGFSSNFIYLRSALFAYVLSLITTKTVMMAFQHAQPALLYICPYLIIASVCTALARGELADLMGFTISERVEVDTRSEFRGQSLQASTSSEPEVERKNRAD